MRLEFKIIFILSLMSIALANSCGKNSLQKSGLIYGGKSFARGKWPWMVAMSSKGRGFICSGTLISKTKVVTGKHPSQGVANFCRFLIFPRKVCWILSGCLNFSIEF